MCPFEIVELEHREREVSSNILSVLFEAYSIEAQLIGVNDFPPLDRSSADIALSSSRFFGAFADGGLRGVLEVEDVHESDYSLGVSSLCVVPDYARQGLGRGLIEFAVSLAKGPVTVSTASANAPAIALYEKMGFRRIGGEKNRHGITVVHFERPVAA